MVALLYEPKCGVQDFLSDLNVPLKHACTPAYQIFRGLIGYFESLVGTGAKFPMGLVCVQLKVDLNLRTQTFWAARDMIDLRGKHVGIKVLKGAAHSGEMGNILFLFFFFLLLSGTETGADQVTANE